MLFGALSRAVRFAPVRTLRSTLQGVKGAYPSVKRGASRAGLASA